MSVIGIFAGSLDPIHRGHVDLIERSLNFCDKVVVALGINPDKKSLFTVKERLSHLENIKNEFYYHKDNIIINSFEGLLVNFAQQAGASILISGVRSNKDFEYEMNLAAINKMLAPQIETILLPTSQKYSLISSSMLKELAKLGSDISSFVPDYVAKDLKSKFEKEDYSR